MEYRVSGPESGGDNWQQASINGGRATVTLRADVPLGRNNLVIEAREAQGKSIERFPCSFDLRIQTELR
jgi:hypothetical protein